MLCVVSAGMFLGLWSVYEISQLGWVTHCQISLMTLLLICSETVIIVQQAFLLKLHVNFYQIFHCHGGVVIYFLESNWQRHYLLNLSIRLSVSKPVNTMFWKRKNQFWCQLAEVIGGGRAWNGRLWGSGGQMSGSHEAEHRFGGLVEASFSTVLGQVAFLWMENWK